MWSRTKSVWWVTGPRTKIRITGVHPTLSSLRMGHQRGFQRVSRTTTGTSTVGGTSYQGHKIVSWWRDGKQPNQSWWVKVAIEGSSPEHHEWRPYVELGAPEPKRRKETKEWASGAVDWSGEGVPFEWESEN